MAQFYKLSTLRMVELFSGGQDMYAEWLFLLNVFLNMALLRFTQAVTHVNVSTKRLIVSSCCSALVAVLFFGNIWMVLVSFMLLIGIGFSFRWQSFFVQGSWLLGATLFAGGLVLVIQQFLWSLSNFVYIVVCVSIVCSSFWVLKKGWHTKIIQAVQTKFVTHCEVQIADETLSLQAYIDTGNECLEPLSQSPVHFISFQAVEKNLPESFRESLLCWNEKEPLNVEMFSSKLRKLIRIVPISTIQNRSVLVPAFRVTLFMHEKTYENHYVVFTKHDARFPQNAQMIAHVIVLINS